MLKRALLIATLVAAPLTAVAQNAPNDNFKVFVSGEGRVTVVPDQVRAFLRVEARSADRKEAAAEARTLADAVRSAVLEAGIPEEKLRTQNVSLSPIYEYGENNQVPRLVGYTASSAIEIKVNDPVIAAEALDMAVEAGATGVDGPYFEVSKPEEAQNEARAMAMKNARERAEILAEAGDFNLGGVITVTDEGGGNVGRPMPMMMKAMSADMAESAPATVLDAGEEEIVSTVRVVYDIVPDDLSR